MFVNIVAPMSQFLHRDRESWIFSCAFFFFDHEGQRHITSVYCKQYKGFFPLLNNTIELNWQVTLLLELHNISRGGSEAYSQQRQIHVFNVTFGNQNATNNILQTFDTVSSQYT